MSSCSQVRTAAAVVVYCILKQKRDSKRKIVHKRKIWVKNYFQKRYEFGFQNTLLHELKIEDPAQLKNFLRMSYSDFEMLLSGIGPRIQKQDTKMRAAISPKDRLLVTLRFLATGDSYNSLMYLFRIPVCTISRIVVECCEALYDFLQPKYLKVPSTEQEWLQISAGFQTRWNFPNCIGAMDGKHIVIQAPKNEGSVYFNYKGTHSIVLLALVGPDYKVIYFDVGCNGRISDGGVFNNCTLAEGLENNTLKLPALQPLRSRTIPIPHVIVADDAFALKKNIMKPFPFKGQPIQKRVFNYRLSRARNVSENFFGLISTRFRVLAAPILLNAEKTRKIVKAICALHNFLMTQPNGSSRYAPYGSFDSPNSDNQGEWRNEGTPVNNVIPLRSLNTHNYAQEPKNIRDEFAEYFVSPEGEVPWQYKRM